MKNLRLTDMRMTMALLLAGLTIPVWAQSIQDQQDESPRAERKTTHEKKTGRGAGKEIGSGAANVGTGAAKGAGDLAKGTGKGAVSLVTLHPIDAAANIGTGAVSAGKDVGVGTVKGSGKIAKGVGKAFKHLF
jgi:hypothetical protein